MLDLTPLMRIKNLLLYLVGNKDAIQRVARDRSAIWYGLFFVMISGVAREYDQESLLHRPYIFLLPVLLSAPLALLYYSWLKIKHLPREGSGGLRSYYGLFWMTAPLAWLYALPVEYLFSSLTAVKLNAGLLGIVASWRVILFARVVAVTTGQPFWKMFREILWGGSVLVFVASFFYAASLTEIMGGTVHSSETALKQQIADWVTKGSLALALALLIPAILPGKRKAHFPAQALHSPRRLLLPACLLVICAGAMALRQTALYRTQEMFNLLDRGQDVAEGLEYMSRFEPDDFAKTWPLPPAGRSQPMRLWLGARMLEALTPQHKPWIEEEIVDYLDQYLTSVGAGGSGHFRHSDRLLKMISQLSDSDRATQLILDHEDGIRRVLELLAKRTDQEAQATVSAIRARLILAGIILDPPREP